MIPKDMKTFLSDRLPERTWQHRLQCEDGRCFMEFGPLDVERLARLGIEVDQLGPHLVVCMWDEASPLEIGGYLVVDNLAMGRPSMGGIRMLPDVSPAAIHNLARGMTLKNAAADLPFGGGKSGIVARRELTPEEHTGIVSGFAGLLFRYRDIYLPGPDVGTNDADMKTVAIHNGMDHALSKPADMGGNRIDQLGAAAEGTVIALEALLAEIPRLGKIPQCAGLTVPRPEEQTILIQGFGAVGAHAARCIQQRLPGARVIGISDVSGYLYSEIGLPVDELFSMWQEKGVVAQPYYQSRLAAGGVDLAEIKFSTAPNDLLRESAFCLIPAAPVSNYLDVDSSTRPSMTIDRMGSWNVIIEGANTYSPDPARKATRARMERAVYRERGVLIATDYLVNSGGVIFAAQEKLIKTPAHLRIPDAVLGNRSAVKKWLHQYASELEALAEQRRLAGIAYREGVIRRNMHELVDLLISDSDMLPAEAAERISVRRIALREKDRTAADLLVPIPTVDLECNVQLAASTLVEAGSPILAVVDPHGNLTGVLTEWDITRAAARGAPETLPIEGMMSRQVVSAKPTDKILDMIRKLEYHEISAMPVVEDRHVLGMVSTDLLARRSLLRLLQSEIE